MNYPSDGHDSMEDDAKSETASKSSSSPSTRNGKWRMPIHRLAEEKTRKAELEQWRLQEEQRHQQEEEKHRTEDTRRDKETTRLLNKIKLCPPIETVWSLNFRVSTPTLNVKNKMAEASLLTKKEGKKSRF